MRPGTPRLQPISGNPVITKGVPAFETRSRQMVSNIDVEIRGMIGAGQQGEVFDALIYVEIDGEDLEIECVAKKIKEAPKDIDTDADTTDSDSDTSDAEQLPLTIPHEMSLQSRITDFIGEKSSADANLLRSIALYQDETGCIYALSSKCDLSLYNRVKAIQEAKAGDPCYHDYTLFKIFCAILNAISTLAELGLVHGDIKPANIMFKKSAGKIEGPILIDYGSMEPEEGTIVGTPMYIAPELCKGGLPSTASDIFSLGAMLKELSNEKINVSSVDGRTEIEESFPLMYDRGRGLSEARKAKELQPTGIDPQVALRETISQYPSLTEGLKHLRDAMFETLPENRPNLETLAMARNKLFSLLPSTLTTRDQSKYTRRLFDGSVAIAIAARTSDTLVSDDSFFGPLSPPKPEVLAHSQLRIETTDTGHDERQDDEEHRAPDTTLHLAGSGLFSPPSKAGAGLFSSPSMMKVADHRTEEAVAVASALTHTTGYR